VLTNANPFVPLTYVTTYTFYNNTFYNNTTTTTTIPPSLY